VVREGAQSRVLPALQAAGAQVSPAAASFEDVFLAATREATAREAQAGAGAAP
jgi:hypothetical protein